MGHTQGACRLHLALRNRLQARTQNLTDVSSRNHTQGQGHRNQIIHEADLERQGNTVTEREENQQRRDAAEKLHVQGCNPTVGGDRGNTHERQQQTAGEAHDEAQGGVQQGVLQCHGDDVGELLSRNVQVEYLLAEGLPVSQKNGCQSDNCQKGVLCVAEELLLLTG